MVLHFIIEQQATKGGYFVYRYLCCKVMHDHLFFRLVHQLHFQIWCTSTIIFSSCIKSNHFYIVFILLYFHFIKSDAEAAVFCFSASHPIISAGHRPSNRSAATPLLMQEHLFLAFLHQFPEFAPTSRIRLCRSYRLCRLRQLIQRLSEPISEQHCRKCYRNNIRHRLRQVDSPHRIGYQMGHDVN